MDQVKVKVLDGKVKGIFNDKSPFRDSRDPDSMIDIADSQLGYLLNQSERLAVAEFVKEALYPILGND